MVLLLKKAGDYQSVDQLKALFERYYKIYGCIDIVTMEYIDQLCRLHQLPAIAQTYNFLVRDPVLMSKNICSKLLLSLLLSKQYDRLCINITKNMLQHRYFLTLEEVKTAVNLPGTYNADVLLSILSVADPKEFSAFFLSSVLKQKIYAFSEKNFEVSVWELYKYLALFDPKTDHSALLPVLRKSLIYFVERLACSRCFM